jgi:hypothetical protein
MAAIAQNTDIADYYLGVLQNLTHDSKLDLISRLSQSLKMGNQMNDITLQSLFGAYRSEETAEEIITAIKASRTFNRNIEAL